MSIESNTTIRDVLDSVYFAISEFVGAFTYLESWILVEEATGLSLVAGEAAYFGLASSMLPIGTAWTARPLDARTTSRQNAFQA